MKKMFMGTLVAVGLIGLSACGGGGDPRAELVKACLAEDGSTQTECDCMADAAVEQLDDDLLKILVDAAKSGDQSEEAMAAMMGELTPDQMSQFMGFAMAAGMQCGMS
ncbi:MAG: hypothetical protein AAGI14_03270 [Pseudomonadota bacterium]